MHNYAEMIKNWSQTSSYIDTILEIRGQPNQNIAEDTAEDKIRHLSS